MHTSLFVDLRVIDSEIRSSGEGRADEGDSVLGSGVVDERVPHFGRHLFSDLVNVGGELVELGRVGYHIEFVLSLEEHQNGPSFLPHIVDASQQEFEVLLFLAGVEAEDFAVRVAVDGRQGEDLSDLVVLPHDLLPEIRHGLNCARDSHDMVEVFGEFRVRELSDDQTDVGIFVVVLLADLPAFVLEARGEGSTVAEVELRVDGVIVDVLDFVVSDFVGVDVVVVAGVDHRLDLVLQQFREVRVQVDQAWYSALWKVILLSCLSLWLAQMYCISFLTSGASMATPGV